MGRGSSSDIELCGLIHCSHKCVSDCPKLSKTQYDCSVGKRFVIIITVSRLAVLLMSASCDDRQVCISP